MIPVTDADLFQVVEEVDYQTHLLGPASSNAISTLRTLVLATVDSFQRMGVKSVHVAAGLGHRFHCGAAPKRKWFASLTIQVTTKRRHRSHLGELFGSRSIAFAFSYGHLE